MSDPLLTTKLYLPPLRPQLVPRPRLTGRLAEGLQRPLTLISAPAGFGKTTLISEWRQASPESPVAWLSLDGGDNDPARFWTYVVAALARLPGLAEVGRTTLDLLRKSPQPDQFLTPLINDLGTTNAILVLDDYHAIESPAVHAAVNFLVEQMPPGLRLVVLTRSDPPWPLARLRAHRLMAELRAADLRFTPAEAATFLNHALGFNLSADAVGALERRTEGWIAALQMVALSLDGHSDPQGFIAAFSGDNRYIADYLAEEVIARQSAPVQEFLLRTALFDRLTASLCEAVTGQSDGQAMLDRIERANLFLVPLDAERRWYRYHHLFADLLRARLRQVGAEQVAELHSRASRWYEANGFGMEAVEQAVAGQEFERAADLIEQHAQGWWALASSQFLDLMFKLPPQVIRSRPAFSTYMAWLKIITSELDASAALIADAERHLQPGSDPATPAFLSLMRTYIAELTGQPCAITEAVRRAPGYIPEQSVAMRNSADVVLAYILEMNGELEEAVALLAGAARRELAYATTNAIPITISRMARIRIVQGRPAEAEAICRQYLALIAERGAERYFNNGNLHAALAGALAAQNRLDEALTAAEEGLRQNERWAIPTGLALALLMLVRVHLSRGDWAKAGEALERVEALSRGRTLPLDNVVDLSAAKIRLWLAGGDVEAAARWAEERGLHPGAAPECRREPEQVGLVRILLAQGRLAEAGALQKRLAAAAEAGGRLGRLAEIRSIAPRDPADLPEQLSDRELEILRLMAAGATNSQIAEQLYLSVGTVKTHVHNIAGKLEAQSRTHAVARARELHLI